MLIVIMVLTIFPAGSFAEGEEIYGISDGYYYYECDSTGVTNYSNIIDPNTITHLFVDDAVSGVNPLGFADKTKLKAVTFLNESDVCIYSYAFSGYENLTSVTLCAAVKEIGDYAFENTSVTTINILADLDWISAYAFTGCNTLSSVVNQSEEDYTVDIHGVSRTIEAGMTWSSGFEIALSEVEFEVGVPVSYQLPVVGNETSETVSWTISGDELPAGLSLSADGIISGTPSTVETAGVGIKADTGIETSEKTIFINIYKPERHDVILDDANVTVTSGAVGTDAIVRYEDYILGLVSKNSDKVIYDFIFTKNGYETNQYHTFYGGKLVVPGVNNNVDADLTITPVLAYPTEKAVSKAEKITLPYSGSIIPEEYAYINDFDVYRTVPYAVELNEGEMLNISCHGTNDIYVDTLVAVYMMDNGNPVLINFYDNNDSGFGEECSYIATETGTYYLFCMIDDNDAGASCTVEFEVTDSAYNEPANPTVNSVLDLSGVVADTSDTAGLWSWDADTKTLILKDGFSLVSKTDGVILPGGATVIVEGKAEVFADNNCFLAEDGDLNILLKPRADLSLISVYEKGIWVKKGNASITGEKDIRGNSPKAGIYALKDGILTGDDENYLPGGGGSIVITDCNINIHSDRDGIQATDNSLTITGSKVKIHADSDGLLVENFTIKKPEYKLTLIDCDIDIEAHDEGIESAHGNIEITDCDIYIDAVLNEEGIYSRLSDIIVNGGRLIVLADEEAVETEKGSISFDDVNYYLYSDDEDVVKMVNKNGFVLPGRFKMLDKNNNIIYEGEWSDELIYDDGSGNYSVRTDDEGTMVMPAYIISVLEDGRESDIDITGIKEIYHQGEDVMFTAVAGADPFPVEGTTGWVPVKWEIEGMSVAGEWGNESFSAVVSTEEIALGEYTLKVTFVKSVYDIYDGWSGIEDNARGIMEATKSYTFKVVEPVPETTEAGTEVTTEVTTEETAEETTEIETTPAITDEESTGTKDIGAGNAPMTGDTNNSMLWIVLAFIGAVGIFINVEYSRRAKK